MDVVSAAGRRARDGVRQFNKRLYNPLVRTFAGRWLYAVVHHTGRSSGRVYSTPVLAYETQDGFAIPLLYGESTDWCKNVHAAHGATLRKGGVLYSVYKPEIVGVDEVVERLPAASRTALRALGVQRFLHLTRVMDGAAAKKNGCCEPGMV